MKKSSRMKQEEKRSLSLDYIDDEITAVEICNLDNIRKTWWTGFNWNFSDFKDLLVEVKPRKRRRK